MKVSIFLLSFFMMLSCLTRRPESLQTTAVSSPNFNEIASEIKQDFDDYKKEAIQQNEQISSEMQTAIHNVEQASIQEISQTLENMDTAQIQNDVQVTIAAANSSTHTNTNISIVSQTLAYGGGGLLIVLAFTNYFVVHQNLGLLYSSHVSALEKAVNDAKYDLKHIDTRKQDPEFLKHLRIANDSHQITDETIKKTAERFLAKNEFFLELTKGLRYSHITFIKDGKFIDPKLISSLELDKKTIDEYKFFYENYAKNSNKSIDDIFFDFVKDKYTVYAKKYKDYDNKAKEFLNDISKQHENIENIITGNKLAEYDIDRMKTKIRNSNIASLVGVLAGATLITLQATNQLGLADTSALGHLKQKLAKIELKIQKLRQK